MIIIAGMPFQTQPRALQRALESIILPESLRPPARRVAETQTAQGSMTLAILRASESGWSTVVEEIAEDIDAHRSFFCDMVGALS